MKISTLLLVFLVLITNQFFSQGLKNADYSDRTASETGTLAGGIPVNYFTVEKKTVRQLVGKEFPYYKTVTEGLINAIDAGWINSPNWKRKYEWNYGEVYTDGLFRTKPDDEKNYPQRFVIGNFFQPAKGHPLYQYMLNKNDSLYQPSAGDGNSHDYQVKVQTYENNPPRMAVNIHINDLMRNTSISEYKELDWKVKLKAPYKVYKRNDSVWFKKIDAMDMEGNDMRFQKNAVYIVIGNIKEIDFSKGMTDGTQEYRWITYPNKEGTSLTRLDHVIIELIGHDESIKLFFDKIDWKKIDAAFKIKAK
ncbi:MAG: hypothetical protein SGJ15_10700 [Bacteroidota bacterium]|nr:hypothetical protein [Bacteroidota bacterium]